MVPSIGSTINVGAGVRSDDEGVGEDSSPRNLQRGHFSFQHTFSVTSGALEEDATYL